MGVDRLIDVTADQRKTLLALLKRHLPNTTAWVYGSRVKWTARPQSDLDVVVFAKPEQERRVSELREAFEESNLPFRVDLLVWRILPEQYRKQIETDHVVLVERAEQGVASEWREIPLAQLLAEPVRNGIYKKKEFHGRGTKIVNMGELFAHSRLRAVPMKRVELSESEADRFLIAAGDLLFARRSLVAEGAGKCCVVLDVDEPTTFESSIIRVRLNSTKADSLYLYYFFNSALGLYHLDTIRRQVAVAGITGSDLTKLDIPVPPLSEQRAIAHILGTLDDKIELNRRMNETLEAMARALFKSWFIDFDPVRAKMEGRDPGLPQHLADLFPDRLVDSELGPIPEGWEVKAIGDIVRRISVGEKYSQKTAAESGIVPILDQGKSGVIGYHNDKPGVKASTSAPIIVFANHTCYMRLIMHDFSAIQNVLPFEGKNHNIYWLFCATVGKQEFIEYKGHWPDFSIKHIVVPEKKLQLEFGTIVAPFFGRAHVNDSQSRSLAAQRDALLPKLISGELRPRDAKFAIEIAS